MLFKDSNKCLQANPNLIYDEACIDILNNLTNTVLIRGQYTECHKCNFEELGTLQPYTNTSVLVNTKYPFELQFITNNTIFCDFKQLFYEHYRYGWNITAKKCSSAFIKEPADNAYLPVLSAFIILFCFGTLWYMVKCIYKHSGHLRRLLSYNTVIENDLGESSGTPLVIERPPSIRKHPHRIKSIDAFRGLCIIIMVFVNYGGGQYWFFRHSPWNGLTVADLVFPWFLWLMGVSIVVSMQAKLRRAVPRRQLVISVIRRSFILILLGIVINSNKNLSTIASLRFPGVLQRIGVSYLIVGILEIYFTKRSDDDTVTLLHDITTAWPQWIFVLFLTSIHTFVTFFVNVPGCGKGYLGPGGLDDNGTFTNCTGGVAGYIDRNVFGEHMYQKYNKLYETTVYYDPEGLLGVLTSVLMVYFGVQAGRTLNTFQNVKDKVVRWLIWGLVTSLLSGILCQFKQNDGLIPINKQLWSLSYVLLLSGMAFILQSFLFVIVDITRKWGGRPFFYPGMNSIAIYFGHELFKNTFPFSWSPTVETHGAYLFMNLWGTAVWVAIAIILYKRNIFFSL